MKRLVIAASLFLTASSFAHAGQCKDDIAKIDAGLASQSDMPRDKREQLEDMRNQAVQLCGAGNEQEGLDVTAEAKALLDQH